MKKKALNLPVFDTNTGFLSRIAPVASAERIDFPYRQHTYVYSAINAIARNVAGVPFDMVSGSKKDKKKIEEGALFDLFNTPNPYFSRYQLWEATEIFLQLRGEAIWVLIRDRDDEVPKSIWVLDPAKFTHVVNNRNVVGWIFKDGAEQVPFQLHEIMYFKYFNPYDSFRGLAPITAATMGIHQDWEAQKYNKAFFENSCDPGGVITFPIRLNDPEYNRLKQQWESRHRGSGKAHKIAIIEGGGDYKQIAISHHDMAFLEQRKFNREEILAVFKVPKSEVSVYEDVNFATATAQAKGFWHKKLIPDIKYIEDVLWSSLFQKIEGGRFWGEFDLSVVEALREDEDIRSQIAFRYFQMGVPFNLINERLNLGFDTARMPWGDEYLIPFSSVPARNVVDNEAKEIELLRDEGKSLSSFIQKTPLDKDLIWKVFLADHTPIEKAMASKLKRFFMEQRAEQLKHIKEDIILADIDLILFNENEQNKKLERMISPFIAEAIIRGVNQAKKLLQRDYKPEIEKQEGEIDIDVMFAEVSPSVLAYFHKRLPELSKINNTIRKQVKGRLIEGLEENKTINELQDDVREVYNFTSARALTIARTETGIALNGGRFIEMRDEGVEKQTWITAGDEHVRDSHAAQNGITVNVGERFPNGLLFPNDPSGTPEEIINCRCTTISEVSETEE